MQHGQAGAHAERGVNMPGSPKRVLNADGALCIVLGGVATLLTDMFRAIDGAGDGGDGRADSEVRADARDDGDICADDVRRTGSERRTRVERGATFA
eukprot:scaffold253465_cov31-Tisochrysis_lutea.AAC.3